MLTPNAITDVLDFKSIVEKYPGFYSLAIYGAVCAVIGYFLGEMAAGRHPTAPRTRALRSIGAVFGLFIGLWLAYTVPLDQLYNLGGGVLFLIVSGFFGIFAWNFLKEGILAGHPVAAIFSAIGIAILTYVTLIASSAATIGKGNNLIATSVTILLTVLLLTGVIMGIFKSAPRGVTPTPTTPAVVSRGPALGLTPPPAVPQQTQTNIQQGLHNIQNALAQFPPTI